MRPATLARTSHQPSAAAVAARVPGWVRVTVIVGLACSMFTAGKITLVPHVFTPAVAFAASPTPLIATDGMVVSASPAASLVGAEILRRGGNAIDAAVAVHFALAVTYPQAGNLGGGGFMLLSMTDGTTEAIDFREVAPAAAIHELFLGPDGEPDRYLSTSSLLAVGVPGSVAGIGLAHERHGTQAWQDLLAPAQHLASEGFSLDRYAARHLKHHARRLGAHPEANRIFLNDGAFWEEGDTLRQPELAATLARISRHGPSEFYQGATAESLLAEMDRGRGLISAEDLRGYRPIVREPLVGTYREYTLLTMPPPSSGGVALLQMLGMLEKFPLQKAGPLSSQTTHLLAEAMKRAFADRAEFLGDPDFTPIPVAGLLHADYLDSLRASIDPRRATPSLRAGPGLPRGAATFYAETGGSPGPDILGSGEDAQASPGGNETTHFSIVDREGNAVAVTTTLNTNYGTGLMATGAGFLLNNELDDFAAAPGTPNYYGLIQGEANAVRPFARPLSSMTPTLLTRDERLTMALGSPGGPRIISSVLQTIINVVDHGMDIQEAIDTPRVHHQWWPDTLYVERRALVADVRQALERQGHGLGHRAVMGSVQGIQVFTSADGQALLLGAADPRRNGCAVGLVGGRLVSRCACPSCE